MQHKRGITREVFLIGKYAFKIPSFRSWYLFLRGMLCNMNEQQFSKYDQRLCPIMFGVWGGWLNIMPRCEPVEELTDEMNLICTELPFVERKVCSFGLWKNTVVAVDYGS